MAMTDKFCNLKVKVLSSAKGQTTEIIASKSESRELIIFIEKSDLFERVSPSRAPHSIKCPSRCLKIENVKRTIIYCIRSLSNNFEICL